MRNLVVQREVRQSIPASLCSDPIVDRVVDFEDAAGLFFDNKNNGDDYGGSHNESSSCGNRKIVLTKTGQLLCVVLGTTSSASASSTSTTISEQQASKVIWQTDLNRAVAVAAEEDEGDDKNKNSVGQLKPHDWFSVTSLNQNNQQQQQQQPGLCCLSRQGAIVTIDLQNGDAEVVGEFENGIQAGCWSPDGQLLVLVTSVEAEEDDTNLRQSVLLTMNTHYDVLGETPLDPHRPTLICNEYPVALCFRPDTASSTQFSIAISSVDVVSATAATVNDDNDNPSAAVAAGGETKTEESLLLRKIRIFQGSPTGDGLELVAMGRTEDGSGKLIPNLILKEDDNDTNTCPLCWAGTSASSKLLATVIRKSKKQLQIAFLEPNGLRHREFNVRLPTGKQMNPKTKVLGLDFNLEADLLLMSLREYDETTIKFSNVVQVWHRSNYQWYLKQEFRYIYPPNLSSKHRILHAKFSTHHPYRFHVLLSNQSWRTYDVQWQPSTVRLTTTTTHAHSDGNITSQSGTCTAFVVDGCSLNTTVLSQAIIPPPMFAHSLELPFAVSQVAFSRRQFKQQQQSGSGAAGVEGGISNCVGIAVLSDASLALLCTKGGGAAAANSSATTGSAMSSVKKSGSSSYNNQQIVLHRLASWSNSLDLDPTSLRNFVIVAETNDALKVLAIACPSSETNNNYNEEIIVELTVPWGRNISRPSSSSSLNKSTVGGATKDSGPILVTNRFKVHEKVLCIVPWSDSDEGALIQLESGQLLEYHQKADNQSETGELSPSPAEPLLEPCLWVNALSNVSKYDDPDNPHSMKRKRLVVGLTERGRLYCHDMLLADAASSFVLSMQHECLSYVTAGSRCQLRFVSIHLLHNFDPLMGGGPDEQELAQGYEPRNVERGTRLVAVLPSTQPSVILQLPRGNLEAVFPRALVIRYAVLCITVSGDYKRAFEMMRRQKVDLNLIVDLNPRLFLGKEQQQPEEEELDEDDDDGTAHIFLEQVETIDHLNLFISSLKNSDCTQLRCKIPSWFRPPTDPELYIFDPFNFADKVNLTCQKLRSIMIEAEQEGKTKGGRSIADNHFLLPILSTFAKQEPPKLEDALSLIKATAIAKHPKLSNKPPLFSDAAQRSIQYLAFLADYELLFETSLGMYDYDLARAVARNSQMDPKVYLPLLKRFKSLPQHYARYEVDKRLKRYDSALQNLHKSSCEESLEPSLPQLDEADRKLVGNDFERCMAHVLEHNLYRLGLELFEKEEERNRVLLALGDHLMETKDPGAAFSIFSSIKPIDFKRMKTAAKACRDWRTLFSLLVQEPCDSEEARETKQQLLAREVADDLIADAQGSFLRRRIILSDAARVLCDYAKDVPGAVDVLIQAELWSEGQRIALLAQKEDLAGKCIESAISYAHTAAMDLEERGETFCTANLRYGEVLKIRKQAVANGEGDADELLMNTGGDNDETGSLFSAATGASNVSYASNTSTGSTTSVSSVISAKSTTSFSLSGADVDNLHKSKFNKLGRNNNNKKDKKKNKKGGKGKSNRILPGSVQELQGLVDTLKSACVDEMFLESISDTITFLSRNGQVSEARMLYDAFQALVEMIKESQRHRLEHAKREAQLADIQAIREGRGSNEPLPVLPIEKEVDSLTCTTLPETIHLMFSHLPSYIRDSIE